MPPSLRTLALVSLAALASPHARGATSFIIQIVVDNDFAFYVGNNSTITRELYHNEVIWNSQVAAASTFSFELQAGENLLYVLAMGGSGEENLSGRINGVNIVQSFFNDGNAVRVSNPVTSFLTGYALGAVSNGTYTPLLSDVQAALDSAPTWDTPSVNTSQTVINNNPFADIGGTRYGFDYGNSTAVLFRFDPEALGLEVPEPSSAALLGFGAATLAVRRRRGAA